MQRIELPSEPKILINLAGSLGDVVRGTVVLPLLRKLYPEAVISWLVESRWKPLLESNRYIDHLFVFDRARGVRGLLQVLRELRREPFDLSLDLQRHFRSGIATAAAGARIRVGFSRSDAKEGNWLFQTHFVPVCDPQQSKVLHYRSFCELLGADPSEPVKFGLEKENFPIPERYREELQSGGYIAVVFGSSWSSKNWVGEGYLTLVRQLLHGNRDMKILFTGDASQAKLGRELEEGLGSRSQVVNAIGSTSLRELFGLTANAASAVGPDSGPAHIAAAFGVPYVSLFGPTDPSRVAPWGAEELVVRSNIACSPCWRRECPGLNRACMRLIDPSEAAGKVAQSLQR